MISRSDSRPEAGFTLIEMVVVVTILGLMLTLVTFNRPPASPATEARAAAQALSGALRSARSQALLRNEIVEFTLDLGGHRYRWGDTPAQSLPPELRLAMLTSQDQLISESAGRIRFNPDGSASGGRISVAGGERIWWVGIDWMSGRVSVAEKPR